MSSRPRSWRSALALVAAGALALSTATTVLPAASAPPPSKAKPDAGVLAAHLLNQPIAWEACDFGEELNALFENIPGLACATVTVPRDWHNPRDGKTITLRISKTATATNPATREGIALVNPGGPGGSGLLWGPGMAFLAPELATEYDFYGFDPRGVGESTPLECDYAGDLETASYEDLALACRSNPLTPYINTEQTAYDMDFIRALMREPKLSYIGYSYGTWLGSWYQRVFPTHTHRFLLDSSTDVTRKSLQETWDLQPRSRDRQFQEAMLPYLGRNAATFGAPTSDPQELRRLWEQAGGTRDPLGQLITGFVLLPAMYYTGDYPIAAEMISLFIELGGSGGDEAQALGQLEKLVKKAAQNPALTADQKARLNKHLAAAKRGGLAEVYTYTGFEFEAIRCQDGPWKQSQGYWKAWLADLDKKAPFIAPLMEAPVCAQWPAVTEMPQKLSKKDAPKTLMIQTELDAATPYEAGVRSAQQVPNTSLISVDNEGSHAIYPYGTTCVDDAVEAYMLRGVQPAAFTTCQAKPLPLEDKTYEVAGSIGPKGTIKLKMRTEEVKKANAMLRDLLVTQSR